MGLTAILTFLYSLLTFVFAINIQDKFDFKDLTPVFDLLINAKKFDQFGKVLTPNKTYNPDCNNGLIQGLSVARNALLEIIPSIAITYNHLGMKLIIFFPLLDKDKRSNRTKFISSTTIIIFGLGNLTEEYAIVFTRFVDKEIILIREAGLDRCRFKNRKFEVVVSLFKEDLYYVSSKHNSFLFSLLLAQESKLILAIFRRCLSETLPLWDYCLISEHHIY